MLVNRFCELIHYGNCVVAVNRAAELVWFLLLSLISGQSSNGGADRFQWNVLAFLLLRRHYVCPF